MRTHLMLAAAVLTLAACGGEKAPPAESAPPAAAPAVAPPATDSATKKAVADSTAKAISAKADGPLRDSAFGPKYTVDEKGKVTPIKKP